MVRNVRQPTKRGQKRNREGDKRRISYQSQAEECRKNFIHLNSTLSNLEGKIKAADRAEDVVKCLQTDGTVASLMSLLEVSDVQAKHIMDMKFSEITPQGKQGLLEEIQLTQEQVARQQQLKDDYEAALRVLQLEEQDGQYVIEPQQIEEDSFTFNNEQFQHQEEQEILEHDTVTPVVQRRKKKKKSHGLAMDDILPESGNSGIPLDESEMPVNDHDQLQLEFDEEQEQEVDEKEHNNKEEFQSHTDVSSEQKKSCSSEFRNNAFRSQDRKHKSNEAHSTDDIHSSYYSSKTVCESDGKAQVIGYISGKLSKISKDDFIDLVSNSGDRMGLLEQYIVVAENERVLLFTSSGHKYTIKSSLLGGAAKPVKLVLGLARDASIAGMVPAGNLKASDKLLMLTRGAQIKCTNLYTLAQGKIGGQVVIGLASDDQLFKIAQCEFMGGVAIGTAFGKVACYNEQFVPESGRTAKGKQAVLLKGGDRVVSFVAIPAMEMNLMKEKDTTRDETKVGKEEESDEEDCEMIDNQDLGPWLLIVTKMGLCKRVGLVRFRRHHSRCVGIISSPLRRDDEVHSILFISMQMAVQNQQIMICTKNKYCFIVEVGQIPVRSRQAHAVKIANAELDKKDSVKQVLMLPTPIKQEQRL